MWLFRMEHSGGCAASRAGDGGGGKGKAPVPRNVGPSWLAGDRAGDCAACASKECMHVSKAGWSWGLPSLLGAVSLARRNGEREMSEL